MTAHHATENPKPRVLIAGAGIGGLFLGIVLERAGIPYEIYERAPEVRTVGSVMGINANILPVFEQLDLYKEFKEISLPNTSIEILYDNLDKVAKMDTKNQRGQVGYDYAMFYRVRMISLLHSKIPSKKIHFNKKIVSTEQNHEGVTIHCEDGTSFHGDILVGADGAYSAVRESLYRHLKYENLLPASDALTMKKGYVCLVGTTDPLDPKDFPLVLQDRSDYHQIIAQGTPYSFTVFNVRENRLCYVIIQELANQAEIETEKEKGSQWSSERTTEMLEKLKEYKIPKGKTLGDLFDKTPKGKISRVYLEDKLFETWTHGRTVLIGDAAHKLLPSAGQGAICAMQDAVILANCLYDLDSLKQESIEAALKDYKEQQYPHVKVQVDSSNINAIILHGQTWWEKCLRYLMLNWIPQSVKDNSIIASASWRPQIAFLPQTPQRGSGHVQPQKPSKRYEAEQKKKSGSVSL
ncbi:hypothetical protein BGZ83_010453 [Gryganskiella cystojenkinii]|nr:hypothetical protein BGZ83_010453 [Gryganskiella cystojenkinii]